MNEKLTDEKNILPQVKDINKYENNRTLDYRVLTSSHYWRFTKLNMLDEDIETLVAIGREDLADQMLLQKLTYRSI